MKEKDGKKRESGVLTVGENGRVGGSFSLLYNGNEGIF